MNPEFSFSDPCMHASVLNAKFITFTSFTLLARLWFSCNWRTVEEKFLDFDVSIIADDARQLFNNRSWSFSTQLKHATHLVYTPRCFLIAELLAVTTNSSVLWLFPSRGKCYSRRVLFPGGLATCHFVHVRGMSDRVQLSFQVNWITLTMSYSSKLPCLM